MRRSGAGMRLWYRLRFKGCILVKFCRCNLRIMQFCVHQCDSEAEGGTVTE